MHTDTKIYNGQMLVELMLKFFVFYINLNTKRAIHFVYSLKGETRREQETKTLSSVSLPKFKATAAELDQKLETQS